MKPLTAGSEIDAWCTKCKLDLGHRIVAMVKGAPKRVVCQTCGSEHNYRAPRAAPPPAVRRLNGSAGTKKPPTTAAQRVTEKARAESDRVRSWESRIAGQSLDAFTRYAIDRRYNVDELVKHAKFGEGYVLEVLDGEKVAIMFRDGPRTLAHGKS